MKILGVSAYFHDSAAALIQDGLVVAAAEEERFSRIKHDNSFPESAVRFCLGQAACEAADLDAIVFYDKPFLKFERLLETYLAVLPRGFASFRKAMPVWLKEKLFLKQNLRARFSGSEPAPPLLFTRHHQAHAGSAFFASPFESAAVLCMDGVGEHTTTSIWHGRDADLQPLREIRFPHSLGLLYSAFTYFAGFKVNSGEYKLMGLAPYGNPRFKAEILKELIDLKEDGSFRLNMKYFNFAGGAPLINERFCRLFGARPRPPESEIRDLDRDLAASIQAVTEEAVLRLSRTAAELTGEKHVCLAGGVALNCVANGRLWREGIFERIWIQPAAGDSGGALGAALCAYHGYFHQPRTSPRELMQASLLGPAEPPAETSARLRSLGAVFEVLDEKDLIERGAESLSQGRVVGWFSGRMEFGPRALGSRSILADPRRPEMRALLNSKIKMRENFRPFAPAVASESVSRYFDLDQASPYMLLVAKVHPQAYLPAITHVDGTARIQTVDRADHPRFHALLKAFERRTGIDVLVNTSFNVRGEPIVCSVQDAYECFMNSGLDALAVENCWLEKSAQPARAATDRRGFAPD